MIEPKAAPKPPATARNRVLVAVLLLVLALGAWRVTHPPLTPEQQIRASMDGVAQAMRNTSPRQIIGYFAPDFKWNNLARDETERIVRQAAVGATQVEVTRSNEKIGVRGDSATASGDFTIRYHGFQEARDAPAHLVSGQYVVTWQKQPNGDWKIAQMQGGQSVSDPMTSDSLF